MIGSAGGGEPLDAASREESPASGPAGPTASLVVVAVFAGFTLVLGWAFDRAIDLPGSPDCATSSRIYSPPCPQQFSLVWVLAADAAAAIVLAVVAWRWRRVLLDVFPDSPPGAGRWLLGMKRPMTSTRWPAAAARDSCRRTNLGSATFVTLRRTLDSNLWLLGFQLGLWAVSQAAVAQYVIAVASAESPGASAELTAGTTIVVMGAVVTAILALIYVPTSLAVDAVAVKMLDTAERLGDSEGVVADLRRRIGVDQSVQERLYKGLSIAAPLAGALVTTLVL